MYWRNLFMHVRCFKEHLYEKPHSLALICCNKTSMCLKGHSLFPKQRSHICYQNVIHSVKNVVCLFVSSGVRLLSLSSCQSKSSFVHIIASQTLWKTWSIPLWLIRKYTCRYPPIFSCETLLFFFKLYRSFSQHCGNVRLSVSQMQQRRSSRPDEQFHYIPIICSHMMCHYLGNIHSSDRKGRT